MTAETDYRRCPTGAKHEWEYNGRTAQTYLCLACGLRVTKAGLKEATDA